MESLPPQPHPLHRLYQPGLIVIITVEHQESTTPCSDYLSADSAVLSRRPIAFINKWIKSENPLYLTLTVFIISYFATSSIEHCTGSVLWQILFGLPIDIWIFVFFAFAWWERLTIAIIGTIIGVPVIIALRKSALMKPDYAAY